MCCCLFVLLLRDAENPTVQRKKDLSFKVFTALTAPAEAPLAVKVPPAWLMEEERALG